MGEELTNMNAIITSVQEIVYYIRVQNYHEGCMRFRRLLTAIQEVPEVMQDLTEKDSLLLPVISEMMQALETDDLVFLGDLLEEVFLPRLKSLVIPKDTIDSVRYTLEITSSGYWTVKDKKSGLYLHSNSNPMEEARLLAQIAYRPETEKYAVWGMGLGYHIVRLYEEARGAVEITVFEEDRELIELAKKYGVVGQIPKEQISFVADKTGRAFAKQIAMKDMGILMHFPSVKKIENPVLKEIMNQFFASWNGTIQYQNELLINFKQNQKNCDDNVDVLGEQFRNKKVVIVGGGPSLDDRLSFLKNKSEDMIIVAATTVLRKLLGLGIKPDYTVVMDSQMRTYGQIEGIENTKIPMLIDSTACWKFAKEYQGMKYLVYQKGFQPADNEAKEHGYMQYETGGSVTTLALEIALKLGAASVFFLGVDLAYPEGKSHASGTMDKKQRDTEGMKKVKAVTGDWVYTDLLFDDYRKWIEDKIRKNPQVDFYNLSTCGANIEGSVKC